MKTSLKTLIVGFVLSVGLVAPALAAPYTGPFTVSPVSAPVAAITNQSLTDAGIASVANNAYLVKGNLASFWAKPEGVKNNASYLAVLKNGFATFSFANGKNISGLSFDWGSVDAYNTLTLNLVSGLTQSISGNDLVAKGVKVDGNHSTIFSLANLIGVKSFTLSSSAYSFEVAGLKMTAVPLPAALPMFGAALVGLVAVKRKARKAV